MSEQFATVPLEKLCVQITDGTHDSPKLLSDGVPFIKGKHISSGTIDFSTCDFISYEDHLKVISRSKPEIGDTLFSNIGSVGDIAYINDAREFSIKNIALLKPDRQKVFPRYLYYLTRRIYEDWFVYFRAPGCYGLPLIDSPLGPIPRGWKIFQLQDLANDIRDGCLPVDLDAAVPYVGLEHIPRRSTTLREWGTADGVTSLKLRFEKDDILFGKIRPYFHKVAVAPSAGVASSDAIIIRAKVNSLKSVVLAITSSDDFVAHAVQTSNGTKMPRADWKVLRQYAIPLPIGDTLASFDNAVWPSVDLAMNLAKQNRNLRTQRDLLLPRLISGEIDVSEAQALMEAAE